MEQIKKLTNWKILFKSVDALRADATDLQDSVGILQIGFVRNSFIFPEVFVVESVDNAQPYLLLKPSN